LKEMSKFSQHFLFDLVREVSDTPRMPTGWINNPELRLHYYYMYWKKIQYIKSDFNAAQSHTKFSSHFLNCGFSLKQLNHLKISIF
jgi:hypothetical protein